MKSNELLFTNVEIYWVYNYDYYCELWQTAWKGNLEFYKKKKMLCFYSNFSEEI